MIFMKQPRRSLVCRSINRASPCIPHNCVVGAPWIAVQACRDANPATLLRASTLGASAAVLYTTTAEPCLSESDSLASYARASRVPPLSIFVVRDAHDAACVVHAVSGYICQLRVCAQTAEDHGSTGDG